MSTAHGDAVVRRKSLPWVEEGSGAVFVSVGAEAPLRLEGPATFLWHALEEPCAECTLTDMVVRETGAPVSEALRLLRTQLAVLKELSLVCDAPQRPGPNGGPATTPVNRMMDD